MNGKRLIILALEISSAVSNSRGNSAGSTSGKVNVIDPSGLVRLLSDLVESQDTLFTYCLICKGRIWTLCSRDTLKLVLLRKMVILLNSLVPKLDIISRQRRVEQLDARNC